MNRKHKLLADNLNAFSESYHNNNITPEDFEANIKEFSKNDLVELILMINFNGRINI